jgi:hypothetical protein
MQRDAMLCLQAVLQFLPLYFVYDNKVSSQGSYVEDKNAMEVLYKHKAVWNVHERETDQGDLLTLKKDAFALLTATLFSIGYYHIETQCTEFLLEQAPDFVNDEVEGKLPLTLALNTRNYCRPSVDMLVHHAARVYSVDEMVNMYRGKLPKPCTRDKDSTTSFVSKMSYQDYGDGVDWPYRTELILAGNESDAKRYRDLVGNTLLHILAAQLPTLRQRNVEHDDFCKCVQKIMQAGINPTHRNKSGQSALHVLLSAVPYLKTFSSELSIVTSWTKLLVSHFNGMNIRDKALIANLAEAIRKYSVSEWIELYQHVMEHDVIDADCLINSGCTPWQMVLRGDNMYGMYHSSCMCSQLSHLYNLAIKKGCNISLAISAIVNNPIRSSSPVTQPTARRNALFVGNNNHCMDCCYFTLLTDLLKCGADIMPLVKMEPSNEVSATLMHMLADPESKYKGYTFHLLKDVPSIKVMYNLCKALILFYPACSEHLINVLMGIVRKGHENEVTEKSEKLHELFTTPRSMCFIAKRCILRSMQRKQIDRLSLPPLLKQYLMEDEVENED